MGLTRRTTSSAAAPATATPPAGTAAASSAAAAAASLPLPPAAIPGERPLPPRGGHAQLGEKRNGWGVRGNFHRVLGFLPSRYDE